VIRAEVKFTDNQLQRIAQATERAKRGNLSAAAYLLMMKAKESIRGASKKRASAPGTPPHAHVGWFRGAVRYKFDKERGSALIGFIHSRVELVASTHEHGLKEDGRQYPQRATMEPALRAVVKNFHERWRNSVG
jgi:hypothetical protein